MDKAPNEKWAKALFDQNRPWLTAFILSQTGSMADSEDLVQETFVRALKRMDNYDPDRPLGAWLRGIARNVMREYWRAKGKAPIVSSDEALHHLEAAAAANEAKWSHPDVKKERLGALKGCMDQLTDRAQELVNLRYQKGQKSVDIAEQLKMNAVAVNVMLMRARKTLQKCINRKIEGLA